MLTDIPTLEAQVRTGIGNTRGFFAEEAHRSLTELVKQLKAAEKERSVACDWAAELAGDLRRLKERTHAD